MLYDSLLFLFIKISSGFLWRQMNLRWAASWEQKYLNAKALLIPQSLTLPKQAVSGKSGTSIFTSLSKIQLKRSFCHCSVLSKLSTQIISHTSSHKNKDNKIKLQYLKPSNTFQVPYSFPSFKTHTSSRNGPKLSSLKLWQGQVRHHEQRSCFQPQHLYLRAGLC